MLMWFRRHGRTRRIALPAYWQATLLPAVPAIGALIGSLLTESWLAIALCAFALTAGVLAAEAVLFAQNRLAWPILEKVLDWDQIRKLERAYGGPGGGVGGASGEGRARSSNGDASASRSGELIPKRTRELVLKGYVMARRNPPQFQQWLASAPEVRNSVLIIAVIPVAASLLAGTAQLSFTPLLLLLLFFLGLQLRRVKLSLDFILTWPLMEKIINWQLVYRDAGAGVEEVEF